MNAITIADRLRTPAFLEVSGFAAEHDLAVGMPDETGRPRVLASIRLVTQCGDCGQAMPGAHPHTNLPEVING